MVKKRKSDLDIMRVIAIIGVIVIHSLGDWSDVKGISVIWSYSTYAVPLLVMISGAVWLDESREVSIKRIWTKYIFHIVIAFAFWSVIYACIYHNDFANVKDFIWRCIIGNYHLWYCYMIVGLYILLPIIKWIKQNSELYQYLIIVVLGCQIVMPIIASYPLTASVKHIMDLLQLSIGNEYLFYFLIGNLFYEKDLSVRMKCLICMWGVVSIICIYLGYVNNGDYSFSVMGYTIFIFVIVKSFCQKYGDKIRKIVGGCEKLAPMCFGIYLVHDIFLYLYNRYLLIDSISPYRLAVGKIIFCFVASYALVLLIRRIPIIGRYIV